MVDKSYFSKTVCLLTIEQYCEAGLPGGGRNGDATTTFPSGSVLMVR